MSGQAMQSSSSISIEGNSGAKLRCELEMRRPYSFPLSPPPSKMRRVTMSSAEAAQYESERKHPEPIGYFCAMDVQKVVVALRNSLIPTACVRHAAEELLKGFETQPGFGRLLVQLTLADEVGKDVQAAAAIRFKNFVMAHWDKEKTEVEINDLDRQELREMSIACLFNSTGHLRKQYAQVVCMMGKIDFPGEWPELMSAFANSLRSENLDQIWGTLGAMDNLFHHYRHAFKSPELWSEIRLVVDKVAVPLTDVFEMMVSLVPQKDEVPKLSVVAWLNVLLLCIKVFHSLCAQDLPDIFEDNLPKWVDGFLGLLKMKMSPVEGESDLEATVLDKIKGAICEVITLFSQRFEEEVLPYMQGLIEAIWGLLVEVDYRPRYDTLVSSALEFLSSICQRQQYEAIFQAPGVLKTICEDVIVKNVMLRECDIEQFEDEPNEYLKMDIEGSDVGTRRRGASEFVRALQRRFAAPVVATLSNVVSVFLGECNTDLFANWLKKDAVYCLVTALAAQSETARFGVTCTNELVNLVDFYESHVRSDLLHEDITRLPLLRADAFKFVVTFRNQLKPQHLMEAMEAAVKVLPADNGGLHLYAAYTIERIMTVKTDANQKLITRENVKVAPIITGLFHVFDVFPGAQSSPYVIKAMMRCFSIIDLETAKSSGEIVGKIATMIGKAVKLPVDPRHLHFLFESLCVLVRQTYLIMDCDIESYILPVAEEIIAKEIYEYVPYALQITALVLEQAFLHYLKKPGLLRPYRYNPFVKFVFTEHLWLNPACTPAMIQLVESLLLTHKEALLSEHESVLQNIAVKLVSSKSRDACGFSLCNVLLRVVDGKSVTEASMLLPMLNRLQNSRTKQFTRQFIAFLARFSIIRGPASLEAALEGIQTGMFRMVMEKIVLAELKQLKGATFEEKRLFCIGFGSLLAETVVRLGDVYVGLVEAIVGVLEDTDGVPSQAKEEAENVVNDDDPFLSSSDMEYTDMYCKLGFGRRGNRVAPEVVNSRAYFAEAILMPVGAAYTNANARLDRNVMSTLISYGHS